MFKAIFFDLDDTLHDHLKPFIDAFHSVFPEYDGMVSLESVYKKFRDFSDILWKSYSSEELTLEELRIQRIALALKSFQVNISTEKARKFQHHYEFTSRCLQLFPQIPELLESLITRGYQLGIITNGPIEHQLSKIEALGLPKYFCMDNIFISDQVGIAKPNPQIFHHAAQKVNLSPKQLVYIGDSWMNDVVGPLEAGWQSIWFNHRERNPETEHQPLKTIWNVSALNDLFL